MVEGPNFQDCLKCGFNPVFEKVKPLAVLKFSFCVMFFVISVNDKKDGLPWPYYLLNRTFRYISSKCLYEKVFIYMLVSHSLVLLANMKYDILVYVCVDLHMPPLANNFFLFVGILFEDIGSLLLTTSILCSSRHLHSPRC